ncbi:MAG: hypothetical protein NZ523_13625 [Elioraea sp.]|nr:hypothetical protein [Elioraea sp.]MDW8445068.1 hypothetical protein [Acetobacteraceae bacterium]
MVGAEISSSSIKGFAAMMVKKRVGTEAGMKSAKPGRPAQSKKEAAAKARRGPVGKGSARCEARELTPHEVRQILDEIDRHLTAAERFYGLASKA